MASVVRDKDEVFIDPTEIHTACRGEIHPLAEKGIRLFDEREYWHAHEALEEAWLTETGPARHLYKGILQAGVTYLQIERKNFVGATKMYLRAKKWLKPWPDTCRGLDIRQLRSDLEKALKAAGELGPDGLSEFDTALFRPIRRVGGK
jgi:hypothetical protein